MKRICTVEQFTILSLGLLAVMSWTLWSYESSPPVPVTPKLPKMMEYCRITPELLKKFEKTHQLSDKDWGDACTMIPDPYGDRDGR